jgi:hypothetical protein
MFLTKYSHNGIMKVKYAKKEAICFPEKERILLLIRRSGKYKT